MAVQNPAYMFILNINLTPPTRCFFLLFFIVIPAQAGIQFCVPQNLRYFALLHRLILRINWIPPFGGMTAWRNSPPTGPAKHICVSWVILGGGDHGVVGRVNKTHAFCVILRESKNPGNKKVVGDADT